MSDEEDNFSTRKIDASEMDKLRDLLDKVERVPAVEITVTADLYRRVESVMSLCDVEAGAEEVRFAQAVNELFEAGLRVYESRVSE